MRITSDHRRDALVLGLFGAVTCALYHGALTLGFLSDDWYFLRRAALASLPELFRVRKDLLDPQSYHYVPLGEAFFWIEYRLFGLHAWAWHAVSLGLHSLNAFLVYRLVARITALGRSPAIAAGLLYATWFLHYETVFFVTEQVYMLGCCLALLALLSLVTFLNAGHLRGYAAYLACSCAALLAIEGGVVVPGVGVLLELGIRRGAWGRRLWNALIHQLVPCLLFFGYAFLRRAGRTSMHDVPPIKMLGTLTYETFGLLSLNVPAVYEACFDRKRAAALVSAALLAITWRRSTGCARLALLAFFVTLTPYVAFAGFEIRYFYIPCACVAVFLVVVGSHLAGRFSGWFLPLAVGASVATGTSYRSERLAEWRRAATIRDRTLDATCRPLAERDLSSPLTVLVVDGPDSVGRAWGASFPAFVFRNGLGEALAFCVRRPELQVNLEFVTTVADHAYAAKTQAGFSEAELLAAMERTPTLRYDPVNPLDVRFSNLPLDD